MIIVKLAKSVEVSLILKVTSNLLLRFNRQQGIYQGQKKRG
jgi:hypothetical protein